MMYLVSPGTPLKLAGVQYGPGAPIEIFGRKHAQHFGDRLIPVTNERLLRSLTLGSHPFTVVKPMRYGRVDYVPGDVLYLASRTQQKSLGDHVRASTGDEVLAWLETQQDVPKPPMPREPEATPARKRVAVR